MRNEEIHIFSCQLSFAEHVARDFAHRPDRNLENLVALHLEEVIATRNRLSGKAALRPAARRIQLLFVTSVGPNPRRQNSMFSVDRTQDCSAGAIAEQDA